MEKGDKMAQNYIWGFFQLNFSATSLRACRHIKHTTFLHHSVCQMRGKAVVDWLLLHSIVVSLESERND